VRIVSGLNLYFTISFYHFFPSASTVDATPQNDVTDKHDLSVAMHRGPWNAWLALPHRQKRRRQRPEEPVQSGLAMGVTWPMSEQSFLLAQSGSSMAISGQFPRRPPPAPR
jgi:hypothetical protein